MLECFALIDSSGEGADFPNSSYKSPLEANETKQDKRRRMAVVEAYRRSWQSIHHR